METESGTQKK